jgi:hypothetical protein
MDMRIFRLTADQNDAFAGMYYGRLTSHSRIAA